MPYRRRRSSGSLMNQILVRHTTIAAGAVENMGFSELSHIAAPVFLLRMDMNLSWGTVAVDDDVECHYGLVSKPRSDNNGVPVAGDLANELYSVEPGSCMASGLGGVSDIDHIHERKLLKILVPAVNDLYFVVENLSTSVGVIAELIRLFWKYL